MRQAQAADWLPSTKFVRPVPTADAVIDAALLERVEHAALSMPATLIVAQAGAGKTTLAAAAVERLPVPVAWVTLDDLDDGPRALLDALVLALDRVVPGGCQLVRQVLEADVPAAQDARRAIGPLLNDVVASCDGLVVLVLDDLHSIHDPAALASVDYLLARMPDQLHVVATTRTEPAIGLPRIRGQGRLAEFTAEDLRLTPMHASTLLNDRLGLRVDPVDVERIVAATAGWVTGIRLLSRAAGIPRGELPSTISTTDTDALDAYLEAEIFEQEPPLLRRFLLDTSVLDELDAASCAAIAGREDAGGILDSLHRRHRLLVLRPDPAIAAYRYHDLLRSFLRRKVTASDPGRLALLHRTAADVVASPGARVDHLLAAGALADAADAVESMLNSPFPRPADVQRVATWLDRLPFDVMSARPRLAVVAGLSAVQRGAMAEAVRALEPALSGFDESGDFAGQWLATRTLHLATNDHQRFAPTLARLETSSAFADLPPAARVDHHVSSAYAALFTGNWPEVSRRLVAASDIAESTADIGAVEVLAQHLSPLLVSEVGAMDRVASYSSWTARRFPQAPPLVRVGILHQWSFISFLGSRFDEALAAVRDAGDLPERLGGLPYLRATFDWVAAGVAFARRDLADAERWLRRGLDDPDATELDRELDVLRLGLLARVLRHEHRHDELADVVASLDAAQRASRYGVFAAWAATSAKVQAAWAAGDLAAAVHAAIEGREIEERARLVPFVLSLNLDRAILLHELRRSAWREAFETVAARAHAWRTPGILSAAGWEAVPLLRDAVDDPMVAASAVTSLALATIGVDARPAPAAIPGTSQVLSGRELEVLRLLDRGQTNRQIADALVVSENTVKTHVKNVMAKLEVGSRGAAVAAARRLHLL